jgi:hypothetical protein
VTTPYPADTLFSSQTITIFELPKLGRQLQRTADEVLLPCSSFPECQAVRQL